jgi:thiol-disulfide isomerase/thioredoxin
MRQLSDSVARAVFSRPAKQDKFFPYLYSIVKLDNRFYQLYLLTRHAYWNSYDYDKSESLLKSSFKDNTLETIYSDENLISSQFRLFIIDIWLEHLVALDFMKDSTLESITDYRLKKVQETYKGKTREYALYHLMRDDMELTSSFENLVNYRIILDRYLSKLDNKLFVAALESKYADRSRELLLVQKGKPAPNFELPSDHDRSYSLDDFKGKVVYLDLWASWCVPCRQEMPSLKILHDKFKNDPRIAFVSIAVSDDKVKWEKALKEDQPSWIQLFDKDGKVKKAYAATFIPRFVLIDKQGKIVDFDSPSPSSGKVLEELLETEMKR